PSSVSSGISPPRTRLCKGKPILSRILSGSRPKTSRKGRFTMTDKPETNGDNGEENPHTDLIPLDSINDLASVLAGIEDEAAAVPANDASPEAQKKTLGLPLHKNTEFMAVFSSVWVLRKAPQKAMLSETGQETEGFMILWRPDSKPPYQYFTTFVGA